jgi:RNA polymerase sigma-70 factor (ECF subfamily)
MQRTDVVVIPGLDAEAELVLRAKAREPNAWQELYDQLYPFVYRYALARLRRHEEAEDLAAQCFLRAIQGIDRYSYQGKPFLAWLYRIARNLVADHVKQKVRENTQDLDADEPSVTFGLDAVVNRVDLLAALDLLKRKHREIIVLRFLLSLSTKEVGILLGKSEAAVHSLQVRAVESLRAKL